MTEKGKEFWKAFGTGFLKFLVSFFAGILGGNM